MRKTKLFLLLSVALALLSGLAFQAGSASAQEVPPVGVVVAYIPGESITIVDHQGNQHEYMLAANLQLLPPNRAQSLGVGSFVTVIAPASISAGKQTAVSIVVHPHIPNGWTVSSPSATPIETGTPVATETMTPTGTITMTETPPGIDTDTPTPIGTFTETAPVTATPVETFTNTPENTPTPTPMGGGLTAPNNTFLEWLRSLFQELLTRQ